MRNLIDFEEDRVNEFVIFLERNLYLEDSPDVIQASL